MVDVTYTIVGEEVPPSALSVPLPTRACMPILWGLQLVVRHGYSLFVPTDVHP